MKPSETPLPELPEDDRHSLAAWLNDFDYDAWDREMVKDFAPGGRCAAWAERVKRQIAGGEARPMKEGFARRGRPQTCFSLADAP